MPHPRWKLLFLLPLLACAFSGCVPVGFSAQVGYASMNVGGDLALESGGAAAIDQGIDSAFGLGDSQGSPYYRAQVDLGGPVLTGSMFWLREDGEGQLQDAFGSLSSGTAVESRLDLGVAKISAAYDIDLGVVKIAPGVMCDVFALDFTARELVLGGREEIDDVAFAPMPFVRAEGGLGPVTAVGELGYFDASGLGDRDGTLLDFEGMIEWNPLPLAHAFVGYRYIGVDASGESGGDDFATDLQIQGWVLGGGIRF